MNCDQTRELFIEMLEAASAPETHPELAGHLASCNRCAAEWSSLKNTMALLDEWKAPEPSPYFQTSFRARLAELKTQEASAPRGALAWLRRPAWGMPIAVWRPMLAGALAVAVTVGISFYVKPKPDVNHSTPQPVPIAGQQASAVTDLQALENNQDLYSTFDLLDDLDTNNSNASPQPSENQF